MRRRDIITVIAASAAPWPLAAHAQQPPEPVVGFLNVAWADEYRPMTAAFRQGLQEAGYIEGQNVTIEYRWAEGRTDRLPGMASDLVNRKVTVIAATTAPAALAAKAATAIIPIVFETAADPIQLGLVASLNRPGGNLTGVTSLVVEVAPKRLELLHELVPWARVIGFLFNPAERDVITPDLVSSQAAAHALGLDLHVLNASIESDFDGVFANLIQLRAGGLVIGTSSLFTARSKQLASLALRHAVPSVYQSREFVVGGGLASYGGGTTEAYRLAGVYTGRLLKGEKPAELPVQQGTKVEMLVNLKTARALGITVPLSLLGRADEVIE